MAISFTPCCISRLYHTYDERAISYLTEFLSDNNPDIIGNAAFGLGKLRAREKLPELLKLLNHPAQIVRNLDSYGALLYETLRERYRSRNQFITIMNNLKLSYPQKMNAAVPANEYCGDFIPQESFHLATKSATDEEQKQIELTVMTNTEIYNDYFARYT